MLSSGILLCSTLIGKYISIRFLWVTTLLWLTNFLEMIILKTFLTSIEDTHTGSICVRCADTEDTFSAWNASVKGVFVKGACAKNTCTRDASTVKHPEIDMQSFKILEVKLLGTWLKIEVEACWLSLCLFWILSRPTSIAVIFKMWGARLEIRVG